MNDLIPSYWYISSRPILMIMKNGEKPRNALPFLENSTYMSSKTGAMLELHHVTSLWERRRNWFRWHFNQFAVIIDIMFQS